MNELLALAVLTGPLWLILVIVAVALVISIALAMRAKGRGIRIAVGVLAFVLLVCLPFADEISGRIYLNHLCAAQAGPRTYHELHLPAEFWHEEGKPKFIKSNGDLDRPLLGNRILDPAIHTPHAPLLGIEKRQYQVRDGSSDRLLGEVVTFMHWGGWIARNLTTHPSATSCKGQTGAAFWRGFYSSLFVKSEGPGRGR